MSKRDELIRQCIPFLEEIKDMTPGSEVEDWLNRTYGPGSALYERLACLIKDGVEEGWAANEAINGARYRRSRLMEPCAETLDFSITAVFMDSELSQHGDAGKTFKGDYHLHPYGEFNMVVPLNEGAALAGPNGWCSAGWTAPAPGSHHYPEVRGGAVIAFFFLPAGRISYNVMPPQGAAS